MKIRNKTMSTSGIIISISELNNWPRPLRNEVLSRVLNDSTGLVEEEISDSSAQAVADAHFAELSPGQVRDFVAGCAPKTRAALEAMARSETRFFNLKDLAATLKVPHNDLVGVWRGLTRRVRTVTGDPKAYLIYWHGEGVYDDQENYLDHLGELTELTYSSLRKALASA
jgi:hypothetical protein